MEMSYTYIETGREGGKGLLGLITHICKSNWKSSVLIFTKSGNFSQSIPTITPWEVINPDPLTAYLIYNCYYMREICKNAENFAATMRGQGLHPASGLGNNIYGYDLDTGDSLTGNPNSRQQSRRSVSCPEPDQRKPMRHNSEWFTTLLEPGTTTNNLMNVRDPITNNMLVYSNVRHTCDEFPPATSYVLYCVLIFTTHIANSMLNLCFPPRVEGGNGFFSARSPSNTRYAALTCLTNLALGKVKAEQTCKFSFPTFLLRGLGIWGSTITSERNFEINSYKELPLR